MDTKVIGVVGYSSNSCITDLARAKVAEGIKEAARALGLIRPIEGETRVRGGGAISSSVLSNFAICSGLTNLGIPALAYEWAADHNLFTIGVACAKAQEHPCYPVNETFIAGENWGDESALFLAMIDALVQVGGGPQSQAEAEAFQATFPNKPFVYLPLTREGA